MKETHALFTEDPISWLLAPVEQSVTQPEPASSSLLSKSRSETALSQTLLNQGASLNKISHSVDELHDTMSDLKQSFKALRLELNTTPSTRSQEYNGDEAMEMLKTVLKELQAKSDEIEKLKLENESLKLRDKCRQGRHLSATPITPQNLEGRSIPEVQSPGFLIEHGKRALLTAATEIPIPDSFDEDHEIMDHTPSNEAASPIPPVKVPLKPAAENPPTSSRPRQEQDTNPQSGSRRRRSSGEPATKRLRLTMTEDQEIRADSSAGTSQPVKERKRGRPSGRRKSEALPPTQQLLTPSTEDAVSNTNAASVAPETQTNVAQPSSATASSAMETSRPSTGRRRRGRSKASLSRSASQAASRPPSDSPKSHGANKSQDEPKSQDKPTLQNSLPGRASEFEVAVNVAELTPESVINENELFPKGDQIAGRELEESRQRQAKVAARDLLAKAAMEREEAMADG